MIWHIVRKEVLGNLLSLRFMLSLILIILLFAVSAQAENYKFKYVSYRIVCIDGYKFIAMKAREDWKGPAAVVLTQLMERVYRSNGHASAPAMCGDKHRDRRVK